MGRQRRRAPEFVCPHLGDRRLLLALAGRLEEARTHLATIRRLVPDYRVGHLLTAMHFQPDAERLFREGAKRIGLE